MSNMKLEDFLRLYRVPKKTEDPAVENRATLRRIIAGAGTSWPLVRTRGYPTYKALPEKDGDVHFYLETKQGVEQPDEPMGACEIQGIYKSKREDARMGPFRQLWGKEVDVVGVMRAWPEHLRSSSQPHLFEIHPVLTIGEAGKKPLDFYDRVIWPTGEDPEEQAKTWNAVAGEPKGLKLSRAGQRIILHTPTHSMQKENYVHLNGYYRGDGRRRGKWFSFSLFQSQTGTTSIACRSLKGTPAYEKVNGLAAGHYEVGGLAGLDLEALSGKTPAWRAQLCPVLSIKRLR